MGFDTSRKLFSFFLYYVEVVRHLLIFNITHLPQLKVTIPYTYEVKCIPQPPENCVYDSSLYHCTEYFKHIAV